MVDGRNQPGDGGGPSHYGVDLPAEAYAFERAYAGGLDLPLLRLKHPWELLALAPEDAAADLGDIDEGWSAEQEANALAHWHAPGRPRGVSRLRWRARAILLA